MAASFRFDDLKEELKEDFGLSSSPSVATKAMFDLVAGGCPMRGYEINWFHVIFANFWKLSLFFRKRDIPESKLASIEIPNHANAKKDDSDEIVIGDKPQDGVNLASDGGAGINYGKYLQVWEKKAKNEFERQILLWSPCTFRNGISEYFHGKF